jgi:hypothetical protein
MTNRVWEAAADRAPSAPDSAAGGLARAFDLYEQRGHADPAGAWDAFNRAYNWAAPLPRATPAGGVGDDVPSARPADGGWLLSGLWRLPRAARRAHWLALPLAGRACDAPAGGHALFVVGSGTLDRSGRVAGAPELIRLRELYVPAGLTASAAGTALREDEAEFLWVVVTAMAMGAARRLTEQAAGPRTAGATSLAADLGVLLRRERRAVRRDLIIAAALGTGPFLKVRSLVDRVERAYRLVRDVYAAAYESAIPANCADGTHPLESLVNGSAPLLQHARFTTSLLPAVGTTS